MLTAVEGIVVNIEVTLNQTVNWVELGTRPKGCRQGTKLLNHQFRLCYCLTVPIKKRR